jgi:hypothetical protein
MRGNADNGQRDGQNGGQDADLLAQGVNGVFAFVVDFEFGHEGFPRIIS